VALHQAGWARRGKPGAFADPLMRDFHTELITRAWPLGQADLLRIAAGPRVIGALYHFLRDGHVYSYQSGFAETAEAKEKPGLVCHAMAIAHYAARGQRVYDLLAGEDRYKLTLAGGRETLHWATLHRPFSAAGLKSVAKAGVRGILSGRR
jgi:CelD/BcsL family acetyltransferase involved in cellulose biosynthesis